MPAIAPILITHNVGHEDGSIQQVVWVLDSTYDRGIAVAVPEWVDRTWHCKIDAGGTLGGGTIAVETAPTDTDADYAICKNAAGGAPIALTAVTVAVNIENAGWMRPRINGGTGASGVRVTMTARRNNGMRQ